MSASTSTSTSTSSTTVTGSAQPPLSFLEFQAFRESKEAERRTHFTVRNKTKKKLSQPVSVCFIICS